MQSDTNSDKTDSTEKVTEIYFKIKRLISEATTETIARQLDQLHNEHILTQQFGPDMKTVLHLAVQNNIDLLPVSFRLWC